jgi:hypothetical protein
MVAVGMVSKREAGPSHRSQTARTVRDDSNTKYGRENRQVDVNSEKAKSRSLGLARDDNFFELTGLQ